MFGVVWGKSAKVKGGVANRPSPQSPKGILGSPPPLVQRMQAPGQSQSLCFQWAAKRFPGKKALPPAQNYLPPSLINLRYRVMTWTFWAIKALFLLNLYPSALALTGGRSRRLRPPSHILVQFRRYSFAALSVSRNANATASTQKQAT